MNLSYWEIQTWLKNIDFTIVGSGIVGLNCALNLKNSFPKAKILILEKGNLPQGASTKNAGFACFGSISETLEDLKHHTEEEVQALVQKRVNGLQLLRKNLGDSAVGYEEYGDYELFTNEDKALYEDCLSKIQYINNLLKPIFSADIFEAKVNTFGFKNVQSKMICSPFGGQINTGDMMAALLNKVQGKDIKLLNNITVESYDETLESVYVKTDIFELKTSKLLIATNGFASQLLNETVKPARAQVLITKPIENLHIKGTFHLDKGYYYFRNVGNRVLFGGARNLDFKTEETTEFALTDTIQNRLEELLNTTILPETTFEIDHRWAGIMGVGASKSPIVKQLSNNVYCGVKLSGMGIAIGSLVGKELADLL